MFLKSLFHRIFLLDWFFKLCHSGKYSFLTESQFVKMNSLQEMPPDILFSKFGRLLHGLDQKSIANCMRLFSYHYYIPFLNAKIIRNDFLFWTPNETRQKQNLEYLKTKYPQNQFLEYEVFYSHHGLMDLPPKALKYIQNKVFIDAGAYDGDSSLVFLEYAPKKIYAFEISEINAEKFRNNMKTNNINPEKVELFRIGLSDTEEDISFEDEGGLGASLGNPGQAKVHTLPVDTFFKDISPVGFIKADVEGFGFKMLKGMTEILKRDRPVLSLSIYHNAEEFLEIKPYLESLNLDYHIQIVPMLTFYFWEVSLIAVPKELL